NININASFGFGLGIKETNSKLRADLMDVTGDGLPDLVFKSGSSFKYYLNTGTGFDSQARALYNGEIDVFSAIGGDIYATFPGRMVIPLLFFVIKITSSLSFGANAGFDYTKRTVRDIDGDGLPDVLIKENGNKSIQVHRNTIGKTHLLKKVKL